MSVSLQASIDDGSAPDFDCSGLTAGGKDRHAINNALARVIALAEDLSDHADKIVSDQGEAIIAEALSAADILRESGS